MTRRLVMIGSDMTAIRLMQRLVKCDPTQLAIAIIGDKPHLVYNCTQLPPLLADEETAA